MYSAFFTLLSLSPFLSFNPIQFSLVYMKSLIFLYKMKILFQFTHFLLSKNFSKSFSDRKSRPDDWVLNTSDWSLNGIHCMSHSWSFPFLFVCFWFSFFLYENCMKQCITRSMALFSPSLFVEHSSQITNWN